MLWHHDTQTGNGREKMMRTGDYLGYDRVMQSNGLEISQLTQRENQKPLNSGNLSHQSSESQEISDFGVLHNLPRPWSSTLKQALMHTSTL